MTRCFDDEEDPERAHERIFNQEILDELVWVGEQPHQFRFTNASQYVSMQTNYHDLYSSSQTDLMHQFGIRMWGKNFLYHTFRSSSGLSKVNYWIPHKGKFWRKLWRWWWTLLWYIVGTLSPFPFDLSLAWALGWSIFDYNRYIADINSKIQQDKRVLRNGDADPTVTLHWVRGLYLIPAGNRHVHMQGVFWSCWIGH